MYFTAGYPNMEDTLDIAGSIEAGGADMVEIGIPFSDPVADGPTIQDSSGVALGNGMTLNLLFGQLEKLRERVAIPVLLMGYVNPVLQYGFENFCRKCRDVGVDGLILPDLPIYEYEKMYRDVLKKYGLYNVFLITPQTTEERILKIDKLSKGFVYMVSSASITGARPGISPGQIEYFERVKALNLKNRLLIGFGISNRETFGKACEYADGAIIGSAFIKLLAEDASPNNIKSYIQSLKARQP